MQTFSPEREAPMVFKVREGALALLKKDGSIDEIQGGYDGTPKPAILKKK